MTGTGGEIRAGYQVAARLGAWEHYPRGDLGNLQPDSPWGVVAEVVESDTFWLDYGGRLDLILQVGDRQYCWFDVTVLPGKKLVIHGIGKPEVR